MNPWKMFAYLMQRNRVIGGNTKKLPQMHDPKKNPIFSWFLGTFEEADLDNSGTMEVPPAFFPEEMRWEDEVAIHISVSILHRYN